MKYSRAVLVTLLTKGLAIILGILTSIVVARFLGPSGRGTLSVLAALVGGAVQFGSLGLNGSVLYYGSREKDRAPQIAWNVLVSATVMGVAAATFYLVCGYLVPSLLIGEMNPLFLFVVLVALPFAFYMQFFQSMLVATQRVLEFNVLDLLSRTIAVAGFIFVLIALRLGTSAAVWSFTITTVVSGALYVARVVRTIGVSRPFDIQLGRRMIRYGIKAYIGSLLLFFAIRVNLFVINSSFGQTDAGLYAVAMQFSDIISLLPLTLGMLLFPKVAGDREDRGTLTAKVFRFSVLAVGGMCLALFAGGRLLITTLFGTEFEGSVLPLWCLTPGIFFLSLWTILNNDLGARGMPNIVVIAPGVALFVNIVGNIALLDRWGIAGSAVSASVASFVGLSLVFAYFTRQLKIPFQSMVFLTLNDLRTATLRLRGTDPGGRP